MQSIMQTQKRCYLTESTVALEKHHVMNGTGLRGKAEKHGLWVWLSADMHRWIHNTPDGRKRARQMKAEAQRVFEETHTHAEWMALFHKNYL